MSVRDLGRFAPLAAAAVLAVLVASLPSARAGNLRNSAVGGVSIDADGVLDNMQVASRRELREVRAKALDESPADLKSFSKLRRVSLKGLESAIAEHRKTQVTPLPDAIQLLAGLQEVRYVIAYPERNDIVLIGPGEGWKINETGDIVGVTTGRPVMQLDDLLIALRSGGAEAIQCSIDPTPEGLARLQTLTKQLKTAGNLQATLAAIEEALGPQVVSVGGVPESSHFARIMVAADFRMKRLAMHFEPAPVERLPSFMELAKAGSGGISNMLPRWWLAPKAEPLLADPDGLTWELPAFGVQCMTEEDFLQQDGTTKQTGKAGAIAKRWAATFTERYDELAKHDAVFGQLRNLIDLAVVGALVRRENLLQRAGLDAPYLLGEEMADKFSPPRKVDTQTSFLKKGRNWLISASGGVQMFPAQLVSNVQKTDSLAPVRQETAAAGKSWWWD